MSAMVSEGNGTNGTEGDDGSRPPRMVFLALIMLVSCVVNVLLLYAFAQNKKARQNVQSITVINLAAVCLGDCVLNMTLVMGSLSAGSDWTFSEELCRWHSFVMSLVLVETTLLLTVLVCDRFLAVKYLEKYDSMISSVRLIIVLVFTWIQSLAFSIPFFFNTVKTTFQQKLHTCSVSDETSLAFICIASVLCFLAPALVIIVVFILIFHASHKQQHEVKIIVTQNHYCDQVKQEPALWKEMYKVKYVAVLCLLWFILEIPYIVTTYIQQYRRSSELNFSVDYPWGVDVTFIWMRFSFSALVPCITFIWRKDLWHCCKECLICHRSNSVLDIRVTVDPTTAKTTRNRTKNVPPSPKVPAKSKDQPKGEVPNLLSFNVPVLFATSDGIHIETPYSDASDTEDGDADCRDHMPKGRQLDITGQSVDHRLPADTSDYDSEAEVYSSQPLSTRHIRGALETNSLPDLRNEEQHERGAPATGKFTSSQGADSGLELSGTMGSAKGKRTQEQLDSVQYYDKPDNKNTNTNNVHINPEAKVSSDEKDRPDQQSDMSSNSNIIQKVVSAAVEMQPDCRQSDEAARAKTPQHSAPSTLPKAQGRLKPLNAARPPKAKTDWPEKKITMKAEVRKSDGASQSKPKPNSLGKNTEGTENSTDKHTDVENSAGGAKSSKEGRGRGHKRTVTSDSEKALLSSDSSMEIQILKTQGSHTDSEKKEVNY